VKTWGHQGGKRNLGNARGKYPENWGKLEVLLPNIAASLEHSFSVGLGVRDGGKEGEGKVWVTIGVGLAGDLESKKKREFPR